MKPLKLQHLIKTALVIFMALNLFLQPSASADSALKEQSLLPCQPGVVKQTVSITVLLDGQEIYNIPNVEWIENETVSLAMKNAKCANSTFTFETNTSCPYGDLVTTIGGLYPGYRKYWQLLINDQLSQKGIDTAIVMPDDKIKWKNASF